MTGPTGAGRLVSVDAFRGATIVAMILVNNPGSWGSVYAPLRHSEWHGWTPTDLVFPFFLFIVGVAIVLALGRRAEAGERVSLLPKLIRLLFSSVIIYTGGPTNSRVSDVGRLVNLGWS